MKYTNRRRYAKGAVTVLAAVAFTVAGCSKDKAASADSAAAMTPAPANSASTAMTPAPMMDSTKMAADPSHYTDANIIAMEIAGDSSEVALGKVAEKNASSAAVKSLAALLVADHGKGLAAARELAKKTSITPAMPSGDTSAMASDHVMQRLQAMTGAAFDSAFVNHTIGDHQDDLKAANAMSGAAQNAQVKAFVDKTIPELQKHLDRAQKISGKSGM